MAEHQEDTMGQYQQWLHYREMERQLRMQIETLEAELAELRAGTRSLEENDSRVDADTGDNELFRLLSLAIRLDAHASPNGSALISPHSPLPQPGIELLPEDMAAFFDEHSQTDPQLGLPWWRQQAAAAANVHNSSPIDQQGLRNKHEIERWLERWGRQLVQPDQPAQPAQSAQVETQGDDPRE